jgi:hypothetical protein
MNTIERDITAAMNEAADAVRVDDGLDAILANEPVIRTSTTPARTQRRPFLLTAAAAGVLTLGAAGLFWASGSQSNAPSTADAPAPPPTISAPTQSTATPATDVSIDELADAVHLQLDTAEWDLVSLDRTNHRSLYWAAGSTITADGVDSNPSVSFVTSDNPVADDLVGTERASDITIAGVDTVIYSDADGLRHAAQLELPTGETTEILVWNATLDEARSVLDSVTGITETAWQGVELQLDETFPTTTVTNDTFED